MYLFPNFPKGECNELHFLMQYSIYKIGVPIYIHMHN